MAMYNNDTDPNAKQWDDEQHDRSMLVSPSYREWWEANKERVLAEQETYRQLNMKWKVRGREDEFLSNYEND
jgi:hypothetical protein